MATRAARPIPVSVCSVQAMVWLPVFGSFNEHTDINPCNYSQGLHGHRERVCTEIWLWEKNPLPHRDSNQHQYCTSAFQSDDLPTELFPPQGGDSSVVRAPDSWLKGRRFESLQKQCENFLLQGRLSMLTLILVFLQSHVKDPGHAAKSAGGRLQLKHAYTIRMWLCMKWHGAWLHGVHRTCTETAAASCGTSHAGA